MTMIQTHRPRMRSIRHARSAITPEMPLATMAM
jgi:hypothetical protein